MIHTDSEMNQNHPPKPIPLLSLSNTFAKHNTHPKSPGRKAGAFWCNHSNKWHSHLFEKDTAHCAWNLSTYSGQIPHWRAEKCFSRRTCRREKPDITLFTPVSVNSARLLVLAAKRTGKSRSFFGGIWGVSYLPACAAFQSRLKRCSFTMSTSTTLTRATAANTR